jgi:hypothetical protein
MHAASACYTRILTTEHGEAQRAVIAPLGFVLASLAMRPRLGFIAYAMAAIAAGRRPTSVPQPLLGVAAVVVPQVGALAGAP